MIFELARARGFDRQVPRVVYPGCKLVDEQLSPDLEELDGEHADVVQMLEQPLYARGGVSFHATLGASGHGALAQDALAMAVFDQGITGDTAITPAHRDQAELALEGD